MSLKTFLVFIFLSFFTISANQQNSQEIANLWQKANELFNKAKSKEEFLEVAGYYKEIITKAQIENGYIYYNLGNAYLKAQQLDYAILNYKKALKYIPNNENLLQNLQIAMIELNKKNTFEVKEQQGIVNYLFFWHFNWKYELRLLLFTILFSCFWLLLFIKLAKPKLSLNHLIVISVFLLLSLGSSLLYNILYPEPPSAILIGAEIEVRKGSANTYGFLYEQKIYGGVEVKIIEKRDNWTKVRFPDDEEGWVKSNIVEKI